MKAPARFVFTAMGSECMFHLYDADVSIAQAAEAEVIRIEERYSRYRAESELSRINQVAATGGALEVDEETAAILDYAFACHRKSAGLFDITAGLLRQVWNFTAGRVPSPAEIESYLPRVGLDKICWESPRLSFPTPGLELDFGGIGKEYAADRAAAVCAEAGVSSGLIDLGGDLRAIGPRPDGTPWPVQIRAPGISNRPLTTLGLATGGLATSGDYARGMTIDGQRYSHILNPHTGWPARGLASVSIVADSCLVAGSVSTIAMLKGASGPAWLESLGILGVWIDSDGNSGRVEGARQSRAA